MRILLDETSSTTAGDDVTDDDLARLYAAPRREWLRINFVSTVDGAATGSDGLSGSINNASDKRIFDLLRTLADGLVVGAGTLRAEGYAVPRLPLVVVSRRADVPETLREAPPGRILVATWAGAQGIGEARELLGEEQVLVTGDHDMDLTRLRPMLAERGLHQLLSEGGPHLFHSMLEAGIVDELDLTLAPLMVAGGGPRIVVGAGMEVPTVPQVLLEEHGSLIGRWLVG
ncbi:dihydrofolate reductase family protein [Nocardioides terrisoli]|uniref:dihydrofolate reductase family protein n=1 Tax=Nocardioides terrisoli TaxID=3388267 RepID=UPI00287BBCB4|nr:dihydrofolate reductase family protein [Nocardioides marmorisolisilvae]